jgi:hypothetical protein
MKLINRLRIAETTPSPVQLAAWQRLWRILLAPNTTTSHGDSNSNAAPGATEAASMDERDGERSMEVICIHDRTTSP